MRSTAFSVAVLLAGCSNSSAQDHRPPPVGSAKPAARVVIAERTGVIEYYPCSKCHANVPPRDLAKTPRRPHDAIELKHMPKQDCYLCHDKEDRDQLKLITGDKISFNDTAKLCGQCHAEKARDWSRGSHGKSTGGWRGERHQWSCAECHDPHSPKTGAMVALPPPPFPKLGIPKGAH